ncbi:MAG: hypothetical protein J6X86_06575 [Bacteroidales bacterium]|nr:hypothetical protein [Bacteroidales bacterium]
MIRSVCLKIAGHTLKVEGNTASTFVNGYEGFVPFIVHDSKPEWRVCYDADVTLWGDAEVIYESILAEINGRCQFSVRNGVYQFVIRPDNSDIPLACLHYSEGSDFVEVSSCTDFSALRFSLWFAYGMLAARAGVSPVHSSVVVRHGKAVLFLGESGTGKSTHSKLWLENIEGTSLLNDDSPMLSVTDGVPYVHGSPWSGKTPCYVAYSFPVAAIVRLSQAPGNHIRRLHAVEALSAIQPSLPPALMHADLFTDLYLDIISKTIKKVPFYHLQCLPDADAARLCSSTIFQ